MIVSPLISAVSFVTLKGATRPLCVFDDGMLIPMFKEHHHAHRLRNWACAHHEEYGCFPRVPIEGKDVLQYILNSSTYDFLDTFYLRYLEIREISGIEATCLSDSSRMDIMLVRSCDDIFRVNKRNVSDQKEFLETLL